LFIQKMIMMRMKNVTILVMALVLYSTDIVLMSEMTWRILVLFVTALSSVTKVRTAKPIALLVTTAPAKQMMTAIWWMERRENLPDTIMSIISAMWTPREKMIKLTAIGDDPNMRSARRL